MSRYLVFAVPGALSYFANLPEPFRGEFVHLWNLWLIRKYKTTASLNCAWSSSPGPGVKSSIVTSTLPIPSGQSLETQTVDLPKYAMNDIERKTTNGMQYFFGISRNPAKESLLPFWAMLFRTDAFAPRQTTPRLPLRSESLMPRSDPNTSPSGHPSRRLLLTFVGQVSNVDMVWNAARTSVSGPDGRWGHGPALAEGIPATMTLANANVKHVWVLDPSGARGGGGPYDI